MIIGIDASRAFLKQRTGVEEYSYQIIKHLINKLNGHEVLLYIRKNQTIDFDLPENGSASWRTKVIKWPILWTQIGLSLEMLFHPIDILFIPAHTVPIIHARNTVVTIHGLEYEFCPRAYSFWARLYMRRSIKNSCRWAKTIIAVSNNTKNDLVKLYGIAKDKIQVIYAGYDSSMSFRADSERAKRVEEEVEESTANISSRSLGFARDDIGKYLLFIGRLEERKNIIGIIKAFEILKEQYKIPHKLILAGKFGYGENKIREELKNVNCASDIILPGYVSEEGKWDLLKNADVFLFPTFYEGFGLPILEAQSAGAPVVCSNNSSILEVVSPRAELLELQELGSRIPGYSAVLVDPMNAEMIADVAYKLISDKALRGDIIKKGYKNVKRFSWEKCASEIAEIIKNGAE